MGLVATLHLAEAETGRCEALVVFRSGSEVYDDAVSGIRESLSSSTCRIRYVDLADPAADNALKMSGPVFTIALGVGAWERLGNRSSANVLAALVLRDDLKNAPRAGAVWADVPLTMILDRLHETFPDRLRVAVIRRPPWPSPDAAVLAHARQLGYEVLVVDCAGPDKLLATFASLKGKADLVIAQPDSQLYNGATVKPLVLLSIEKRLPIVGFSAGFVRAGALAGIYPDFHELGRQTGELAERILTSKPGRTEEDARKVVMAVNPRLVRLLGIEPARQEGIQVLK